MAPLDKFFLKKIVLTVIIIFIGKASCLSAQPIELPYDQVNLNNLNSFQPTTPNWEIVGGVFMDLYEHHAVQAEDGTGMLVNTNESDNRQDIYTAWKHGDLYLELDFMMAKESNSGIYFQGRYELQLLDSWGVENPKFSDLGGIYEWWDEDGKGVGGIAPRVNAARAPGLWQHLEVQFRAPRFNEQGEKIANARFLKVVLNGVTIHENIEHVHPTGGAMSNEEVETAPLRFQGDHGPVAFKNIRYKIYDNAPVQLNEISYRYFEGEFDDVSDFEQKKPLAEGKIPELSLEAVDAYDKFAVIYNGNIQIEEAGEYLFELRTEGGNRFIINGEKLIETGVGNNSRNIQRAAITLSEGTHSFELAYYKNSIWWQPALGLFVEGPGIAKHPLHVEFALPTSDIIDIPSMIDPDTEPIVLRGFVKMNGQVHTHSAAIGYPKDINYAFDLNSGALLKIWKGQFINATPIWEGRGGGNLTFNEDAAIGISGAPSLAFLKNRDTAWPDSLPETGYSFENYKLGENGYPTFSYRLGDIAVKDRIVPENESKVLTRYLTLDSGNSRKNLYCRVTKGKNISQLPNGLYQIDGKAYYVRISDENQNQVRIRDAGDGQELIISVPDKEEALLGYSFIW